MTKLNRVIREELFEKVVFEQRLGVKGSSHMDISGKRTPGCESVVGKSLRQEHI